MEALKLEIEKLSERIIKLEKENAILVRQLSQAKQKLRGLDI